MSTPQTFGIRRPDGYVQGKTEHIAVTVDNGRVVMMPAADPNGLNWDEDEYARFMQEQTNQNQK